MSSVIFPPALIMSLLLLRSVIGSSLRAPFCHGSWSQKVKLSKNYPSRVLASFKGDSMSTSSFHLVAFLHEGDDHSQRGWRPQLGGLRELVTSERKLERRGGLWEAGKWGRVIAARAYEVGETISTGWRCRVALLWQWVSAQHMYLDRSWNIVEDKERLVGVRLGK
jgi:hypothetical protein